MKPYTATKSRNAGRESRSVIFRHPARLDVSTGKPGRRVRRGLGTGNEAEANRLVDQLNEILRTEELWEPAARAYGRRPVRPACYRHLLRRVGGDADRLRGPTGKYCAPPLRIQWLPHRPVAGRYRCRQDDRGAPAAGDRPGNGTLSLDIHRQDHRGRHRADHHWREGLPRCGDLHSQGRGHRLSDGERVSCRARCLPGAQGQRGHPAHPGSRKPAVPVQLCARTRQRHR